MSDLEVAVADLDLFILEIKLFLGRRNFGNLEGEIARDWEMGNSSWEFVQIQ